MVLPPPGSAQEEGQAPQLSIPAIPGVPGLREHSVPSRSSLMPAAPENALAVPPTTAVKVERLRPEFQPGLTYRFVVKREVLSVSVPLFTLEQQIRYDAKVRVDGKPGVLLKARTERLDLDLATRDLNVSYRSLEAADQDTPLGRHLRTTLNASLDLLLNEKGRIDEAKLSASREAEGGLPAVPHFGPEELEQLVTTLFQSFPEKRIGPGDRWKLKGQHALPDGGQVEFDLMHQHSGLSGFEGQNCLLIEFTGNLSGHLPDAELGQAAQVRGDTVEGRIYFDPLDRMVRFSEQSAQLRLAWGEDAEPEESTEAGEDGSPDEAAAEREARWRPVRQTTTIRLLHVVPTP